MLLSLQALKQFLRSKGVRFINPPVVSAQTPASGDFSFHSGIVYSNMPCTLPLKTIFWSQFILDCNFVSGFRFFILFFITYQKRSNICQLIFLIIGYFVSCVMSPLHCLKNFLRDPIKVLIIGNDIYDDFKGFCRTDFCFLFFIKRY